MKYPKGPISLEFKNILKAKLVAANSESELDTTLNDLHDAILICRNDPNGLRAAVKHLESTNNEMSINE